MEHEEPEPMKPEVDYAIVGAGAVGACCAILLTQLTNKKVALIGDLYIPDSPQRTYALNRVSQTLLTLAGTWQRLNAVPYTSMEVFDIETGAHMLYRSADYNEPDLGHMVTDSKLAKILSDQIDDNDKLLRFPCRLQTLVNDGKDTNLVLEDGSQLSCKLLIAADGKHSHVASLCGIKANHRPTGDVSIVSNLQLEKGHGYSTRQWFSHRGIVALLPLEDSRQVSLVWSTDEQTADKIIRNNSDELSRQLTQATLGYMGDISLKTPPIGFKVSQHNLRSYCQPGLAFIGDAAHSVHPLAGQGMNMGLQDLLELLRQLLKHKTDSESRSFLPLFRFQQSRQTNNLKTLILMRTLQKTFRSTNPVLKMGRLLATRIFQDNSLCNRYAVQTALYGGLDRHDLELTAAAFQSTGTQA